MGRVLILVLMGLAAGIGLAVRETGQANEVSGGAAPPDPAVAEAERERRIQDRTERAKREAVFNQLDQDGDGYLSEAELGAKENLEPPAEKLDQDGDGRVSRTEFAAVETAPSPDDAGSASLDPSP